MALALCGVAVSALAVEGATRWLGLYQDPWNAPPKRVLDPYKANPFLVFGRPFLFYHIPGSAYLMKTPDFETLYQINSRGFRGPEIPERPLPGARRLLAIGDSMTEGAGVEFDRAFPALIDEVVRPLGWETVNAGVQGGSPIYYAANLPRYLALHPDAGLIVLYDNDVVDDYSRERDYETFRRLPCPERLFLGGPYPPRPASYALALLAERARRPPPDPQDGVEAVYQRRKALGKTPQGGLGFLPEAGIPEARWEEMWERSRDYLDLIARRFRQEKVDLFVAHLSLEFRAANSSPARRRHADLFEESLGRWARERQIPFYSLREALAGDLSSPGRPAVLFPGDPHLNLHGHQVVARALSAWLLPQLAGKPKA